jgi:hypothetical protein
LAHLLASEFRHKLFEYVPLLEMANSTFSIYYITVSILQNCETAILFMEYTVHTAQIMAWIRSREIVNILQFHNHIIVNLPDVLCVFYIPKCLLPLKVSDVLFTPFITKVVKDKFHYGGYLVLGINELMKTLFKSNYNSWCRSSPSS